MRVDEEEKGRRGQGRSRGFTQTQCTRRIVVCLFLISIQYQLRKNTFKSRCNLNFIVL
jgi:hypothetical protein